MKQYDGVVTVRGNQRTLNHRIAPPEKQSVHVDDRRRMGALQRALDDLYQGSYTQKVADNYTAPTIQHAPATDAMLSGMDRMYATMGNGLPPSSLDRVTYDNALPTKFTSSKSMKARTVAQVVAAEAGYKTSKGRALSIKDRLQAMRDIYSAAVNRATLTGETVESIISGRKQFSAYNHTMPAGTPSLVGLAKQAIADVTALGPTHEAAYYATTDKVGKLPGGLSKVKSGVDNHVFFSDPKNRAIITASGPKVPSAAALPETVNVAPRSRPSRTAPATPGFNIGSLAAQGGLKAYLDSVRPQLAQAAPVAPDKISSLLGAIGNTTPRSRGVMGLLAKPDMASLIGNSFAPRANLTAFNPSRPASPVSYAKAEAPRDFGFPARPEHIARNTMRSGVQVAETRADINRMTAEQAAAMSPRAPDASRFAREIASVRGPVSPERYASVTSPAEQMANASKLGSQVGAMAAPQEPGMITDAKGTFADPFGTMKPGGVANVQKAETARMTPGDAMAYAEQPAGRVPTQAQRDSVAVQPGTVAPDLGVPQSVKDYTVADIAAAPTAPDLSMKDGRHIAGFNLQNALAQVAEMQKNVVAPTVVAPQVVQPVRPVRQPVRQAVQPAAVARPNSLARTMSGLTFGNITPAERFSVDSIDAAIGGPRGATAQSLSDRNMSYTSKGANLGGFRRNEKFGFTQPVDASGAVMGGIKYDDGKSAISHALGSIFGGSDKDKGGKSSSSSGGKSRGGRGAAGGRVGQSQHSL